MEQDLIASEDLVLDHLVRALSQQQLQQPPLLQPNHQDSLTMAFLLEDLTMALLLEDQMVDLVLMEVSDLILHPQVYKIVKYLIQLTAAVSSVFMDFSPATKNAKKCLNCVMAIMFRQENASVVSTNSLLKMESVWIKNVLHGKSIDVRLV